MNWLLPLVGFSLVSSVTPGPNNILLWASGAQFGFVRTVPHVLGTAVGLGAMTLAVAAGLGIAITSVPQLAFAMKVGGVLVAVTMMVVIVPAAAVWAGGGDVLNRLIEGPRLRRVVGLVLAAIVVATVAAVWI